MGSTANSLQFKMLIPKTNRITIYEALFKDGVMVAIKDFNKPKHANLETIPNLQVIKAMQSLKSRGFVRENFAWRHFYWYLTNEGIQYLRDYLHLPPEIVPSTLRKATKPSETAKSWSGDRDNRGGDRDGGGRGRGGWNRDRGDGDRDQYRRGGQEGGEKGGAPADFKPNFRGGFGGIGRGEGFGGPPRGDSPPPS